MTSSLLSSFADCEIDIDLGRRGPSRSTGFAGAFSFMGDPRRGKGDSRRVGVGIAIGFVGEREGVRGASVGETLPCLSSRCGETGLRGVCQDHGGASSVSCNIFKSLREERRFLRGGPVVEGTSRSPIVPNAPG